MIVEEDNLEVDESLLTGEADPIAKDAGDTVMSGSFVVAGSGAYRATKVGREAYAAQLAEEASKFTLVKSELRTGINKILQFITYLLVPAGLLIIYTQLFTTDAGWRESVLRMVGGTGADGARGPGADDVGRVRGRRGPARPHDSAWSGAARHRGSGPRRRGVPDKTGTLTENGMRRHRICSALGRAATSADVLAQLARRRPAPERQHAGHRRGLPGCRRAGRRPRRRRSSRPRKWSGTVLRRATATG